MTASDIDDPSAVVQVREWLPWFAAGTLAPAEQQFVHAWLDRNGAQHASITAELNWLRRTATQARELVHAHSPAPDAGLVELMARIGAERRRAAPAASGAFRPFRLWLADLLAPRPALAFAVVAMLLLQAAVIGSLMTREPAEQVPLGGATSAIGAPADSVWLSVAFHANAREADIRAALARAGAQIVGGPSALGLYRVAVHKAQADAAMAALLSSTTTVESVQREP